MRGKPDERSGDDVPESVPRPVGVDEKDEKRLAQFSRELRRSVFLGCFLASLFTGFIVFLSAVLKGSPSAGLAWSVQDVPSLEPTTSIGTLAVVIVVLAAVAFSEDRSAAPSTDVVELRKNQLLRGVAAFSGQFSAPVALWGAVGAGASASRNSLGQAIALASCCLGLGALLMVLGGVIKLDEPARLRELAERAHAREQERFVKGLARWEGPLPTLTLWSDKKKRRGWRARVVGGLVAQVLVLAVGLLLVTTVLTTLSYSSWARANPGRFVEDVVLVAASGFLLLAPLCLFLVLFAWLVSVGGGVPKAIRWLAASALGAGVIALLLVVGLVAGHPWAWIALAPSAALIARVAMPVVLRLLRRRVTGVSTSWPGAVIDDRFSVLLYYHQSATLTWPRPTEDDPDAANPDPQVGQ